MIDASHWNIPGDIAAGKRFELDALGATLYVETSIDTHDLNDPVEIFVEKNTNITFLKLTAAETRAFGQHLVDLADAIEKAEWVDK